MPNIRMPRHGSMQFWPRKQVDRVVPRIRSWPDGDSKILGFSGYKVGMTHVFITDTKKASLTKGEEIFCPVTVVECPPIKVAGIRFYKKDNYGLNAVSDVYADNLDKELARTIILPKKKKATEPSNFDDIRLIVYTQPKNTSIGKKKPEVYELGIKGKKEDKLKNAKELLGKEISVKDVFKPGQLVDVHGITKAKGFQGPVKRFGVSLRRHKSEKTKRGPGSLGGWQGQAHFMYRVAHAGRMGYHQRIDSNKLVIKVSDEPKEINPKGGFIRYGNVKNTYVLIKGSIAGTSKRSLIFTFPLRGNLNNISTDSPQVQYISLESKQ
nr:50S ribosomal protein L3P [uncultured archaeon]